MFFVSVEYLAISCVICVIFFLMLFLVSFNLTGMRLLCASSFQSQTFRLFFKKKNTGQNICLVYHKLCPAIHAVNTHKYYFLAVTSGAIEEGQLLPNALKVYINVCWYLLCPARCIFLQTIWSSCLTHFRTEIFNASQMLHFVRF